jgi:hypothetical protein
VHACNPSTQKTEVEGSHVQGQLGCIVRPCLVKENNKEGVAGVLPLFYSSSSPKPTSLPASISSSQVHIRLLLETTFNLDLKQLRKV